MNCNSKTMLKTAAALGIATAVAYFTLPAAHAFILASAPLLVVLICPVAMIIMMMSMNTDKTADKKADSAKVGMSEVGSGGNDADLGSASQQVQTPT